MKLTQLVVAGDYLSYKGDWTTNTTYAVNDCVTWAADGHMYQVIKAHTSSSSFDPDNAEYYKPMTNKTFSEVVYDLTNASSKSAFFTALNNMDKRPFVKIVGTVDSMQIEFNIANISSTVIKLQSTTFATNVVYMYCLTVNASADNVCSKVTFDTSAGSFSAAATTLNSLTVTNLD